MAKQAYWLVQCGLMLLAGCNSQDADRLAKVGRKAASRAGALTGSPDDKLSSGWDAARASWDDATVDARVAARLRWDKALTGTSIQVHATDGVVELRGKVHDLAQRRRAVELAETTSGVERVTDTLEVPSKSP